MFPPDRHTLEWIAAQQARLGMADPIILEKTIFALTLLDLLARKNLDFVFKGGTALLLHLSQPNRLSIDIDYLDDVILSAFHLCALDLKGAPKDLEEENRLYRRGINQLGNHLVSTPLRLPEAKLAAAKAAHLARILKSSSLPDSLPVFDPAQAATLRDKRVAAPFACLNRLKTFAPEVFFLWT